MSYKQAMKWAGKWTIQELEAAHDGYSDWQTYIIRDDKTNVALAEVGHIDHYKSENNLSNAHLIAAAPDMLGALERCDGSLKEVARDYKINLSLIQDVVRQAITKAKGE